MASQKSQATATTSPSDVGPSSDATPTGILSPCVICAWLNFKKEVRHIFTLRPTTGFTKVDISWIQASCGLLQRALQKARDSDPKATCSVHASDQLELPVT